MERIAVDGWEKNEGHIYRYELAEKFLNEGEVVYDIACGIGYGSKIITKNKHIDYVGIDKVEPSHMFKQYGEFFCTDLNIYTGEGEGWDVSVSFETMEHIIDPIRFSEILKKAKKRIVLSVPTVPTKHLNDFHLHDFDVDHIIDIFKDWRLKHLESQPEEYAHIFIFDRIL